MSKVFKQFNHTIEQGTIDSDIEEYEKREGN